MKPLTLLLSFATAIILSQGFANSDLRNINGTNTSFYDALDAFDKIVASEEDPNFHVEVLADCFPDQLSWAILDEDENVLETIGAELDPFELKNYSFCLPSGCYFLDIVDTGGDGLNGLQNGCTTNGAFNLFDRNGDLIWTADVEYAGANFGATERIPFCVDILGCTDPIDYGFNPLATTENHSECFGSYPFYLGPNSIFTLSTDCNPEETTWALYRNGELYLDYPRYYLEANTTYEFYLLLPAGCYEYRINDVAEGIGTEDCPAAGNSGFLFSYTITSGETQSEMLDFENQYSFEFCIEQEGCMSDYAVNYNPDAVLDNGSCFIDCDDFNAELNIFPNFSQPGGPQYVFWSLEDENGELLVDYISIYGRIVQEDIVFDDALYRFCLPPGCYDFIIYDTSGSGLSTGSNFPGNIIIRDGNGGELYNAQQADDLGFATALHIPICIENPCPGDISGDAIINVQDLLAIVSQIGCVSECTIDLDSNGNTDILDLLAMVSLLGGNCE